MSLEDAKKDAQYVDRPELDEVFSDFVSNSSFENGLLKLEFCVVRWGVLEPPKPPKGKKYPVSRLLLTLPAAVSLTNRLNQMLALFQQQGLVKIEQGSAVTIQ